MSEVAARHRFLAYAVGGFGLSMNAVLYLLVPLRADELGAGVGVIGLLIGVKALFETVLSVPMGAFMDRVGAKRSIQLGTAATALVGVGMMAASSLWLLFVLQALMGVVRPLGWIGGQSYAAGLRGGSHRSHDAGRFSSVANLGQIVSPILAGALAGWQGPRAGFAMVVALGAVFFAVSLGLLDVGRAPAAADTGSGFGAALGLMRLSRIQTVMFLTFNRLWVPAAWSSFFPLYLVGHGVSPTVAGSVISAMAVVATVTSFFTGRIARLGTPVAVTSVALALGCLGVAVSPVFDTMPLCYLAAALVGIGQGLSLPMLITLMSDAAPPEQRSLALGLRSGVNQAAATVAPVAIGPLIGAAGLAVGFPVAAGIGLAFVLAATWSARRDRVTAN
ncbi:MFS transporter [Jiangella rhizosphaerae]|uniref:MFS transporter n=1 Tax=Jiangella rhizosphaerae TaxID=2293569 RepID=A0A418KWN3_9ACTN|nr:MFS transporter [Jiangella rhizosphaerae]RIQ35893.1 MFS transporter [Jiangella rhizosphaerae]